MDKTICKYQTMRTELFHLTQLEEKRKLTEVEEMYYIYIVNILKANNIEIDFSIKL